MLVHKLKVVGTGMENKCVDVASKQIMHSCKTIVKSRNRCHRPTTGLSTIFRLVRFCVILLTACQLRTAHPSGTTIGKSGIVEKEMHLPAMAVDDKKSSRKNGIFREGQLVNLRKII